MGKVPYICTDSDETEDTSSSVENVKKKKKLSILKYTHGNFRKKKCKLHTKSEPDDSDYRTRSRTSHGSVKSKLPGILKHRETERELSSEDEEDSEPARPLRPLDRYLVGRVPRPAGAKPGRGGGVAIIVKKNISSLQAQQSSTSSTKKRRPAKRLARKKSY
ncbi:uncharacterized protein [Epargyreus clarus]|uniref:uncharacterized protein isoform X2 n=1 Tax=Epargyreus clarus TaxID=520877 RepID=UPI003C306279